MQSLQYETKFFFCTKLLSRGAWLLEVWPHCHAWTLVLNLSSLRLFPPPFSPFSLKHWCLWHSPGKGWRFLLADGGVLSYQGQREQGGRRTHSEKPLKISQEGNTKWCRGDLTLPYINSTGREWGQWPPAVNPSAHIVIDITQLLLKEGGVPWCTSLMSSVNFFLS